MQKKTIKKPKPGIRRNPEPVDIASILRAPAQQPGAATSNSPTPKLTPYAQQLLSRSHGPKPGAPSRARSGDWLTTTAAAKLTGYSRRHIYTLCERGFFVEGKEWKQRPILRGMDRAGKIRIQRAALKKLEEEW